MVAQELALRHPHRVRRLVLACTSSVGAGGASYPLHELAELDPDTGVARRMELLDTRWDEHWRATHPEMVALIAGRLHVGRQQTEAATAGLPNQLAARAQHDTTAQLGAIACPTFVCGGRFDALAPTANSQYLAGAIPARASRCSTAGTSSCGRTARRCRPSSSFSAPTHTVRPPRRFHTWT